MLHIMFEKPACQNIRESLRKEWLETNGRGDYASSTIPCCNTRKYHGLLVANLAEPGGRYVLLSALEESLTALGKEFYISCRKHPGVYHPRGHEYMVSMETALWPTFCYKIGDMVITREIMMVHRRSLTLMRYQASRVEEYGMEVPLTLVIKPLLAFRHFHALTHANVHLQVKITALDDGFSIRPYDALPTLYMQLSSGHVFYPSPDWVRTAQYMVEEERGFEADEDLFLPGVFEIPLACDAPVVLSASTDCVDESLEDVWQEECERRRSREKACLKATGGTSPLMGHLAERAEDFLIATPYKAPALLAGYHWFDAWGRDTCIALAGLSLWAGNVEEGVRQLASVGASARDGLIPNCFAPDGVNHAFNSVDASLFYVWAVQQFDSAGVCPEVIRDKCWPVIKSILDAFMAGPLSTVFVDNAGLLHAGSTETQLTWMDATVHGRPVTPRHGCPVEINALWYNALAYAAELTERFGEPERYGPDLFETMRKTFKDRFWVRRRGGGYLADTWRDGHQDTSLRPNQLFAVALPYAILDEPDLQCNLVESVRKNLLTPFGLRTLAPSDPDYRPVYFGRAEARDGAYHQGTVWPWPLGAYTDALIRVSQNIDRDVAQLLESLTPLFVKHLARAGLGSISEVFDASPPHYPNGCIAQAWSVAEVLRMLRRLHLVAPDVFAHWEAQQFTGEPLGDQSKAY